MLRYISTILLVLATVIGKTQTFSYSQNYLSNKASAGKIIGQVKDHIIVWYVTQNKYKKSVILVYDHNMNLIRRIKTDILYSDIDPAATFYNSVDSFYVAYQYQKGNKWEYKLAGFDDNGNLSSTYLIDNAGNLNTGDSVAYNYYQSGDKKMLACVKSIFDPRYKAIKFESVFLNHGILDRDQFVLPFDDVHEKLVDFLIDSNKNITLLQTSGTDSGFTVSVIKRIFSASCFLMAEKTLAAGNLCNGTSHIFNKGNSYTVYGVWKNVSLHSPAKDQTYKTGLYLWKVNDTLADISGDTILYDDSTRISELNHYTNHSSTNPSDDFYSIQTDSVNLPDPSANLPSRMLVYQGDPNGKTGYYNYIELSKPSVQTPLHYKAGLTIVDLNNQNKI